MAGTLYVVTGATGHVGSVVAGRLLDRRHRVRVIGRSAERLAPFAAKGAETAVGGLDDFAFAREAFQGAGAAFVMVPPDLAADDYRATQERIVDSVAAALEADRVGHVVTLSSIGAHLPRGNGPIAGLHDMERRFNRIPGLSVLHLRPGYFMENTLASLGMMRARGIHGGPLRGDVPLPMIATRDIGAVAAARLMALDFTGSSVLELMGPRDVTMQEVTAVFGKALGRPDLRYVQFPYADAREAMLGMGLRPQTADLYVEMTRGLNEGTVAPTQRRTAATTTPTSFEAFVAALPPG